MPQTAIVVAITGEKDTNALPKFGQEYVEALRRNGVENARFISAKNATHFTSLKSKELVEGLRFALEKLGAGTKVE